MNNYLKRNNIKLYKNIKFNIELKMILNNKLHKVIFVVIIYERYVYRLLWSYLDKVSRVKDHTYLIKEVNNE